MKILANENIPQQSVQVLRQAGHDVFSISETNPGITDREVLALADSESRVLVTFDGDYGELVFLQRLPTPPAILYLRFVPSSPQDTANRLISFFEYVKSKLDGYFWVLEDEVVRRRPLPTREG